jgi:hypothetical protein
MRAVGGTLSVSIDAEGWFHLSAECPAEPAADARSASGSRPGRLSPAGRLPARPAPRPSGCVHGAWQRRR